LLRSAAVGRCRLLGRGAIRRRRGSLLLRRRPVRRSGGRLAGEAAPSVWITEALGLSGILPGGRLSWETTLTTLIGGGLLGSAPRLLRRWRLCRLLPRLLRGLRLRGLLPRLLRGLRLRGLLPRLLGSLGLLGRAPRGLLRRLAGLLRGRIPLALGRTRWCRRLRLLSLGKRGLVEHHGAALFQKVTHRRPKLRCLSIRTSEKRKRRRLGVGDGRSDAFELRGCVAFLRGAVRDAADPAAREASDAGLLVTGGRAGRSERQLG
jgi:hypothetical protein